MRSRRYSIPWRRVLRIALTIKGIRFDPHTGISSSSGFRVLDIELLPKNPLWRAIISIANANNLITLDMDTLSTLRDNSATPHCTNWTWISSQIWEIVPQQGEDDRRVDTEKFSSTSIARRKTVFSAHGWRDSADAWHKQPWHTHEGIPGEKAEQWILRSTKVAIEA